MIELPYQASFSFELVIPACKVGKEGLYQELIALIKKQSKYGLPYKTIIPQEKDGKLYLVNQDEPFANLFFKEELTIGDNNILFTYEERSNQELLLPNIFDFVGLLLLSVKTSEMVCGGFEQHSITCSVKAENNTNTYFYEKYSPLEVDYLRLLTYSIGRTMDFAIEIERVEEIYVLFNRFYQQFKTAQGSSLPFVTVNKDKFNITYGEL